MGVDGSGPPSGPPQHGALRRTSSGFDAAREVVQARVRSQLFGEPYQPVRAGRFALLHELGRGGMGVVHASYDDVLDRKVAVKFIHPRWSATPTARERLLFEARAMAKLSHPNVVQVYEAGEHTGQLFVAMEFVDGPSLREWLTKSPTIAEVLDVFALAGEGLAAAHEAGIVHGDFKPDNVLLSSRGTPKVADFGLAGRELETTTGSGAADLDASQAVQTRHGALIGTPAYMAPEQFDGATATMSSDQYAYCVALFEALYRQHPLRWTTLDELRSAARSGATRSFPSSPQVTPRMRAVLSRGLSVDPEQRFADMRGLLEALRDARRRRRPAAWAGAGLLVGAIGAGWWWPAADGCERATGVVEAVWSDRERDGIRAAFAATGLSFANDSANRVIAHLDAHAERWVALQYEACSAHLHHEQSDETFDRRTACLHGELQRLRAIAIALQRADATAVEESVGLVASLSSLDRCADAARLLAEDALRPPPAERQRVAGLEERLAAAAVQAELGHAADALPMVEAVLADAEATGFEPLVAAARSSIGALQRDLGHRDQSEQSSEQAYFDAGRIGASAIAAETALDLAALFVREEQYERADQWVRHAEMMLRRGGLDGTLHAARLALTRGQVATGLRRFDAAVDHLRAAERAYRSVDPPDWIGEQSTLNSLSLALGELGRFEEAVALLERNTQTAAELLGPGHPRVATGHLNLGALHYRLQDFARAEQHTREALEIWIAAYGPETYDVASARNNLGNVLLAQQRIDAALVEFEAAAAIQAKLLGPDHADVLLLRFNLVNTRLAAGQRSGVREELESLVDRFGRELGPDHAYVGYALTALGETVLLDGDPSRAVEVLERALALRRRIETPPDLLAETMFALGKAEWASGSRETGLALAGQALELLRGIAPSQETGRIELVQAWLAEHGRGSTASSVAPD